MYITVSKYQYVRIL